MTERQYKLSYGHRDNFANPSDSIFREYYYEINKNVVDDPEYRGEWYEIEYGKAFTFKGSQRKGTRALNLIYKRNDRLLAKNEKMRGRFVEEIH